MLNIQKFKALYNNLKYFKLLYIINYVHIIILEYNT